MKIFLTARLGPFLFIDIFRILGLSSATCKYTCEPLGHLWREISGERTSWGFSGFFRSYCSVVQLCLTLFDPMDCSTPGFLVPWTISRSFLKLRSLSRWCHPTISSRPFSSCLWSFPASGSSPVSQLPARWRLSGDCFPQLQMCFHGGFNFCLLLKVLHQESRLRMQKNATYETQTRPGDDACPPSQSESLVQEDPLPVTPGLDFLLLLQEVSVWVSS